MLAGGARPPLCVKTWGERDAADASGEGCLVMARRGREGGGGLMTCDSSRETLSFSFTQRYMWRGVLVSSRVPLIKASTRVPILSRRI